MIAQIKPAEAKCLVQLACELDKSDDVAKMGEVLHLQIEEQLKLTEYEQQTQLEMKIKVIKDEITHAEQQAIKARNEEEIEMIKQQIYHLNKQEESLVERFKELEIWQSKLQQQEAQVKQQEQILKDQIKQLEEILVELTVDPSDAAVLQQQMTAVVVGSNDVNAAQLRLSTLQHQVQEAQKKLRTEERRQQ